jgi:esterase/lipase superfamily enzyme
MLRSGSIRSAGPAAQRVGLLVVVSLALALSGCGTKLMKTPSAVTAGGIDPFGQVPPERQTIDAPVLVASPRAVSGREEPTRFYSNDRNREVRLGVATVEIGPGMTWDELYEQSIAARRSSQPAVRLATYEEFGPLWTTSWPPDVRFDRDWDAPGVDRAPADRFVEVVESMLADSRRRQITIYVHGFNTKFAGNLAIAGEFWHYMARDEVLISFDWPSKGNLFSYEEDKANADFAIRQFRTFIEFLAEHTSADQINIIGHSAGSVVVAEALRQLALKVYDLDEEAAWKRTRLGHVILAAPDMDLDAALSIGVDGVHRIVKGVGVYASRKDKALGFSGNIFGDVRLGKSIGKLPPDIRDALIANQSNWIDATNAQKRSSSFIGHSYYHQNPWVSSDVMIYLRFGATPEERGLVRDEETGFLVFPDDYEERLPEVVRTIIEKYEPGARTLPAD